MRVTKTSTGPSLDAEGFVVADLFISGKRQGDREIAVKSPSLKNLLEVIDGQHLFKTRVHAMPSEKRIAELVVLGKVISGVKNIKSYIDYAEREWKREELRALRRKPHCHALQRYEMPSPIPDKAKIGFG